MCRVRVGQVYEWRPVPLDQWDNRRAVTLQEGDQVRVVNCVGCPKANTMGHCFVETLDCRFVGLVCTNSLQPLRRKS